MESVTYKAFISYSHNDERWARWLHRRLENYRIPASVVDDYALTSNRVSPVFRDRDELASSSDLSATIHDALSRSDNLIVICSPGAAASRWVNEEIAYFKKLGKADHIHCFLIGDPATSFPEAILQADEDDEEADTRQPEPLAADARPEADGRQSALLKLIAGVMSLPFDELRQREAQYRYRRMLIISSASIAFAMLTLVLALSAFFARQEAERQRQHAEQAQHNAELREKTARRVSDFLTNLFNASDPWQKHGGELGVRELLDRGARNVGAELESEPQVRMEVLTAIARAYVGLGEMDAADELFHNMAADLAKVDVGTQGHVRFLMEQASFEYNRRNLDAGQRTAEEAVAVALEFDLKHVEARARMVLSNFLLAREQFDLAQAELQRAKELLLEVGDKDTASQAERDLGVVASYQGNREQAIVHYKAALAHIGEAWGEQHPQYSNVLESIALATQDQPAALAIHERALAIRQAHFEPTHPIIARSLWNIGRTYNTMGQSGKALPLLQESVDLLEGRFDSDFLVVADVLETLAIAQATQGLLDAAEESFRSSQEIYLKELGPNHFETLESQQNLAILKLFQGRPKEALDILTVAIDNGYRDADVLRSNRFEQLFDDPRYQALVESIE